MTLLQLHEYLALLARGTARSLLSPPAMQAALAAAEAVWPRTGLSPWSARERTIAYAWRSQDDALIGAHVTADAPDCFVIVVLATPALTATGFLVFDIGAEYRTPIFKCPDLDFEGPADEATIREGLLGLDDGVNSFAVLSLGGGTYLQTAREKSSGLYRLEHQLVTTGNHYWSCDALEAAATVGVFLSYAFGRKEWATNIRWEREAPG